jgi:hypothetical protein
MDVELQAIPGMGETALFAVSERLLRAFSRGRLWTLVNLRTVVYPGQRCAQAGMTKKQTVSEINLLRPFRSHPLLEIEQGFGVVIEDGGEIFDRALAQFGHDL